MGGNSIIFEPVKNYSPKTSTYGTTVHSSAKSLNTPPVGNWLYFQGTNLGVSGPHLLIKTPSGTQDPWRLQSPCWRSKEREWCFKGYWCKITKTCSPKPWSIYKTLIFSTKIGYIFMHGKSFSCSLLLSLNEVTPMDICICKEYLDPVPAKQIGTIHHAPK